MLKNDINNSVIADLFNRDQCGFVPNIKHIASNSD